MFFFSNGIKLKIIMYIYIRSYACPLYTTDRKMDPKTVVYIRDYVDKNETVEIRGVTEDYIEICASNINVTDLLVYVRRRYPFAVLRYFDDIFRLFPGICRMSVVELAWIWSYYIFAVILACVFSFVFYNYDIQIKSINGAGPAVNNTGKSFFYF